MGVVCRVAPNDRTARVSCVLSTHCAAGSGQTGRTGGVCAPASERERKGAKDAGAGTEDTAVAEAKDANEEGRKAKLTNKLTNSGNLTAMARHPGNIVECEKRVFGRCDSEAFAQFGLNMFWIGFDNIFKHRFVGKVARGGARLLLLKPQQEMNVHKGVIGERELVKTIFVIDGFFAFI